MIWRLKRNIFGISLDLYLDDIDLVARAMQKLYELRLRQRWNAQDLRDRKQCKGFMSYALQVLPKESFVTFAFDPSGLYFVQFGNLGGCLTLDVPVWSTNFYYGKDEELTNLLKSQHFRRTSVKKLLAHPKNNTFIYRRTCKDHKIMRAFFGNNWGKAAEVGLLIAEQVFAFQKPALLSCDTDRLAPARGDNYITL